VIDSIHDVLARVHERARLDISIVATEDAVRMSQEIAKLRSELGAQIIRAEEDARAAVALMDAAGAIPIDEFNARPDLAAAINALYEQFEDRIDEHDKRSRVARLVPTFGKEAARAAVYGDATGA
jgi:hypothetical protein